MAVTMSPIPEDPSPPSGATTDALYGEEALKFGKRPTDWVELGNPPATGWRKPGSYIFKGIPPHQIYPFAAWNEKQKAILRRGASKGLILEIYRKTTQDLLILFITRANAGLERHLIENLNQIKGVRHALSLAEQWEKS